jgi:putative oxidoreductase
MLVSKGFWATAHESRTDWSMFFGLLFLLTASVGARSLVARLTQHAK